MQSIGEAEIPIETTMVGKARAPHREARALPHPPEWQIQLSHDLDPWTLERLETPGGGTDLVLSMELWPRLEHPGGWLSAPIQGLRLAVPRADRLRPLGDAGHGTDEPLELRIPDGRLELAGRAIDGIPDAQHRLQAGDHGGRLTIRTAASPADLVLGATPQGAEP